MGAARYEYDPQTQKSLLRVSPHFSTLLCCSSRSGSVSHAAALSLVDQAASFGKCFLADFSADPFVATCRELRVLNAVRVSSVGLPLTYPQYPYLYVVSVITSIGPFGVQLGFPSVPAQIHSLHLHFRFKHLTLPVLIDR